MKIVVASLWLVANLLLPCKSPEELYLILCLFQGGGQWGLRGGLGPSNVWINVNKCVFNRHTIKIWVSCSWGSHDTSAPSKRHLTVSDYLSNAPGKRLRAPRRTLCQLNKPFKGSETRQCWKEVKRIIVCSRWCFISSLCFFYSLAPYYLIASALTHSFVLVETGNWISL